MHPYLNTSLLRPQTCSTYSWGADVTCKKSPTNMGLSPMPGTRYKVQGMIPVPVSECIRVKAYARRHTRERINKHRFIIHGRHKKFITDYKYSEYSKTDHGPFLEPSSAITPRVIRLPVVGARGSNQGSDKGTIEHSNEAYQGSYQGSNECSNEAQNCCN